jgi:hypothetical protein
MIRAGLGYLAAADPGQLATATQAEFLRELEQDAATLTAVQAWILAAFTAGQGPAADGDYNAVSWLMHRTGITKGAAVGHSAWAKRIATHPKVLAALAAGQVSESTGRVICLWTGKLPWSTGTRRTGSSSPPPRAGWAWPTSRPCSPRCTSGPAGTCPIRTRAGTSRTAR